MINIRVQVIPVYPDTDLGKAVQKTEEITATVQNAVAGIILPEERQPVHNALPILILLRVHHHVPPAERVNIHTQAPAAVIIAEQDVLHV